MKPAADLAPIEDLDRNILTFCSHINAATYELLAWRCDCRSGPWPRSVAAATRLLETSVYVAA